MRGLRIPVATVVAMVADGMSPDEIMVAYPDLSLGCMTEGFGNVAAHLAAGNGFVRWFTFSATMDHLRSSPSV